MSMQQGRLNIALLGVPEVTASTLYGMLDLFASPGRDFLYITRGSPGEQHMQPFVVARTRQEICAANGVVIRPDHDFSDCPRPDIVCIPDFFVSTEGSIAGQYDQEVKWLRKVYDQGAVLASACSGAVLLGEAGLLANCDATIHWAYVAYLKRNYPGVRVKPHQSLVLSGEAQRIFMAGGGTSWQDLALYLIARFVGIREATEVARVYMLQWHDQGQQPFASLMGFRQTHDALINKCQDWAAHNYRTRAPVAAMAALSGLPDRSFVRRFSQATGLTPLDYIHGLRLEEAKQMLETSDLPVEAIANEVGYEDTSFFGRLFRRKVGLTPMKYRLRFGSLHRALNAG
jgi:transcriptional regulator GlxA family with amidase domain